MALSARRRVDDEEIAEDGDADQAYSLGRILAISDGVYAFALTLLVVQLAVPTANGNDSLGRGLLDLYPSYFSYALSFTVIALAWTGHHQTFKYIRRADGRLIALNFAWLLLIALVPFPTAVLGRYGHDAAATVLYAVIVSLTGLVSTATWWYAVRERRLVSPDLDQRVIRLRFLITLSVPAVFLSSIPIAVWRPDLAEVAWTVFWIVYFLFVRRMLERIAGVH